MTNQIEQLSLFDNDNQGDDSKKELTSALPESATEEWRHLYAAIADYAKRLNPKPSDK